MGFLAILIIEDSSLISFFEQAAETILLGQQTFSIRRAQDEVTISVLKRDKADFGKVMVAIGDTPRAVLIAARHLDVPAEFIAAANCVEVFCQPDESLVMGAVHRMCGTHISRADVETILARSWQSTAAAFHSGRSAQRSMQILKRSPEAKFASKGAGVDGDEIGVEELVGYGEAKEWALQAVSDIKAYGSGTIAWDEVDRGLLLSGPPGTGKTRFAKALAKSCGVPYLTASIARWQSAGHMGDMLRDMHLTFDEARKQAPCILLIDEIDAIGNRVSADRQNRDYIRQVISGLLELLDGSVGRDGVLVVGTSNFPEFLDSAFTRSGRLEKHIRIALPDGDARGKILERYLGFKLSHAELAEIVPATEGWSGADLERLARQSRRMARREAREVAGSDVLASLPASTAVPFEKLQTTALHEAGHAIVGLKLNREILGMKLTERYYVSSETMALGGVRIARDEWQRRTTQWYFDDIAVMLAGMAAEMEVLGSHDDGCGGSTISDLAIATNLATSMIGIFGMGGSLVSEVSDDPDNLEGLRRRDPELRRAVDKVLHEQLSRARQIVADNRVAIERLAERLVDMKSMSGDQVARFVANITRGPDKTGSLNMSA